MKKAIMILGMVTIILLATSCIYSTEVKDLNGKYVLTYFSDDDDVITTAGIKFETVNDLTKATYFDTDYLEFSDISDVVMNGENMLMTFTVDGHRYNLKKEGKKLVGTFVLVYDGEEELESQIKVTFEKQL